MSSVLQHRGPDGEGFFNDGSIQLLHRLLKIFNSNTEAGPYLSRDGNWVLSFNGEIYNHAELAREWNIPEPLTTDGQILLEGWARLGEKCLSSLNGMFAFALWDKKSKRLYLGRDRLGEKPLYYGLSNSRFAFASEIKALEKAGIPLRPNSEAIPDYLNYRYVSGPETLFKDIFKVQPGEVISVDEKLQLQKRNYWSFESFQKPSAMDSQERVTHLKSLIDSSMSLRKNPRIKPSLFLSGGVDSSCLASYLPGADALTFQSSGTVNEGSAAASIAEKFSLSHKSVSFTEQQQDIFKKAIWALEEPIGDSIILPVWTLAQAASRQTRVVFSGEGADELFAGYIHHWSFHQLLRGKKILGPQVMGALLALAGVEKYIPYPAKVGPEARQRLRTAIKHLGEKQTLGSSLTTLFAAKTVGRRQKAEEKITTLQNLLALDVETWLPDYTLTRMDKLLMSFGVEGRFPFLDHRIAEFAATLPISDLYHRGQRKWILRQAMAPQLGKELAFKKKVSFIFDTTQATELKLTLSNLRERNILPAGFDLNVDQKKDFLFFKRLFAIKALDTWAALFQLSN